MPNVEWFTEQQWTSFRELLDQLHQKYPQRPAGYFLDCLDDSWELHWKHPKDLLKGLTDLLDEEQE